MIYQNIKPTKILSSSFGDSGIRDNKHHKQVMQDAQKNIYYVKRKKKGIEEIGDRLSMNRKRKGKFIDFIAFQEEKPTGIKVFQVSLTDMIKEQRGNL